MARPFTYTPEEVSTKAYAYIDECEKKDIAPLLQEFALLIGVTDDTLTNWMSREEYSDYSEPIKRIKKLQEVKYIRKVEEGQRPIGPMFLLKANHGYVEKQHVEHSGQVAIGELLDSLEGK